MIDAMLNDILDVIEKHTFHSLNDALYIPRTKKLELLNAALIELRNEFFVEPSESENALLEKYNEFRKQFIIHNCSEALTSWLNLATNNSSQ